MSYHPWRDARSRKHLEIAFGESSADCWRGSFSPGRIEVDSRQSQAERRCTIAHELVHDERRVFPRDPALRAREEVAVERIAARRLVALERLLDVLRWTRHTDEVADELWVDVPMLVALVRSLTDEERTWIDDQLEAGAA
ncbi:ImmA/IrrE family metallo-endopeptidase [Williamsia deligens]|uniref:ImmA/IrrE family metallo-endopeptidase n=1 Tax=Williamsia deligens TaxID=321325 RepID=A0ABW3GE25_9NOCA|nr:ImmA/IrrE family metallo-endopeptidase [Williamsia deligens]MCP2195687.1 protein of unknown function (DUF955) [Williamsia deligens]